MERKPGWYSKIALSHLLTQDIYFPCGYFTCTYLTSVRFRCCGKPLYKGHSLQYTVHTSNMSNNMLKVLAPVVSMTCVHHTGLKTSLVQCIFEVGEMAEIQLTSTETNRAFQSILLRKYATLESGVTGSLND